MDYKYERLPIFCHYCGILGHDFKNCAAHYAAEKNGGAEEYQYGEFLRAIGGRSRGSASQSTSAKSSSAEGAGHQGRSHVVPWGGRGPCKKKNIH